MMDQKRLTQLFKRQRKSELYNEIAHMKETLPQNPYKLYSGIRFDHNSRPVEIIQPLDLNELKLIVRKKCNIKLRSDRIERAYQRSGKNTTEIQKNLGEYEGRTVIRLKNNYPYNLKPKYEHWIAWCKGYTWKEIEELIEYKRAPFIKNAVFHWINNPKFRSIESIPHYHLTYEK